MKLSTILLLPCCAVFCFLGKTQAQLYIQPGGSITASGEVVLTLDKVSFTNDGIFEAGNSRVLLLGDNSAVPINIGGNSQTFFHELAVNTLGQTVQLLNDISLDSSLSFLGGNLDLNGFDIMLEATGFLLNENELSHVIGQNGGEVIAFATLNAPSAANPGNLGAIITSAQDLGPTIIRRGHLPITSGGNTGILRHYDIAPANNSGLDATLRFQYLDAELNSHLESELELWQNTGINWENQGASSRDEVQNFVEQNGINDFSTWTMTGIFSPFPVEWIFFKAHLTEEKKALLEWATASETNSDRFEVERSGNGLDFVKIGEAKAGGFSTTKRQYSLLDERPMPGTNYYRLQQIGLDGTSEFSAVVSIHLPALNGLNGLEIYPNPVGETLYLRLPNDTDFSLELFDETGRLALAKSTGNALDVRQLQPGFYTLRLTAQESRAVVVRKVVVSRD